MTMRIFGRKTMAVLLAVSMLLSCAVFSFSASAAETLMWENDFNDKTGPWYTKAFKGESDKGSYNSGTVGRTDVAGGNFAVYEEEVGNGYMKLGYTTWDSRKRLSGFQMHHKTATTKGVTDAYGGSGVADWRTSEGAFSPAAGTYKVELDYQVKWMNNDASTELQLNVGFADADLFFWDGDKTLSYFTASSRKGTYQTVATIKLSDVSTEWKHVTAHVEITGSDDRSMHIFLANTHDGSNACSEILVDNIKVTKVDGTTPTPPPAPDDSSLRWENDFGDKTAPWYTKTFKGESDKGSYNSGTVGRSDVVGGNFAVYEEEAGNGYMTLGYKSWNSRKYLSGFQMHHKTVTTEGVTDAYGGSGLADWRTKEGAFAPVEGRYRIELDYKLRSMDDDSTTEIQLNVGFADADAFFWDGDKSLSYFTARKGIYQTVETVKLSDVGMDWEHATTTIEITGSDKLSMHVFLASINEDASPCCEVLVDNVKIFKEEVVTPPPQPTGPVLMWKNAFDNGDTFNWASQYGGKGDNSYWNSGKAHTDTKNYSVIQKGGDNGYMTLGFANEAAGNKLSGFVFLHEEATHNLAGQYGYGGGSLGSAYGRVLPKPGYYILSFDYKLNSITDVEGAAFDFGLSFCSDLLWDGQAGVDYARLGVYGGAPQTIVTLTASALGQDWTHVTYEFANLSKGAMNLYFYVGAADSYTGSLEGSELWVDNFEIQENRDESLFTKYTFFYEGDQVGQSAGSLPGMYFEMPTLTLPTIPYGYKVVYYADAEYKNMIPVPTVYPETSTNIYVRIVQDTGNTWGFETEANGTKLSLNDRSETAIVVDNTAEHNGAAAARVNSDGGNGSRNQWAQMLIKDGFDKLIKVDKGRTYKVKFYLYVPVGQTPYTINYWLTATEEAAPFDPNDNDVYSVKGYCVAEGSQMMAEAGKWVEVNVTIKDCPHIGYLRLGLNGDGNKDHPFYIDDITVISTPADPNAWSFEAEAHNKLLSVNTRIPETIITVDDSAAVFSGEKAVRVNSDGGLNSRNLWPQMFVKNGASDQVYVYKSRSYEVKMYVFVPEGQPDYDVSYWLAATEQEEVFNIYYDVEYSLKNYMVAEGVHTPNVGEWTELVIKIDDCPYTGKLRIGFNGNGKATHPFYIDDISVNEVTREPDTWVESYERYEEGKKLSLAADSPSITVSGDDSLSGEYSAKIVTLSNNINAAPQMVVTDTTTSEVKLERGKSYYATFWVCVPITEADYDVKYWFAVTDDNDAFTLIRKNVVVDTQTVTIRDKQAWQLVRTEIADCAYSGTLRLGITGSTNEAHTFYLDDIYVKEITASDNGAMNFEAYEPDTALDINHVGNNTIIVSNAESYTGGQSVHVHADNNAGDRPQMQIRDTEGNMIKVKKGDNFYVSFMIYIPETEPYFSLGYYITAVPEDRVDEQFRYQVEFSAPNYMLWRVDQQTPPPAGEWTQIKIAVLDAPLDGYLRLGICHGNGGKFESNFYIDDIKVYEPEYVKVKFETNGSEDAFEDMTLLSDMLVPYDGVDPYREGYEFLGWYTDKNFSKDSYFDIYTDTVVGKTGDVVTLYARWRKWEDKTTSVNRDEEVKYKVEYYEEKEWVGDQNLPEYPYSQDGLEIGDSDPVATTPDNGDAKDAMPPWLIVVIIAAAVVVVGGGAVIATVLIKKSKKA